MVILSPIKLTMKLDTANALLCSVDFRETPMLEYYSEGTEEYFIGISSVRFPQVILGAQITSQCFVDFVCLVLEIGFLCVVLALLELTL